MSPGTGPLGMLLPRRATAGEPVDDRTGRTTTILLVSVCAATVVVRLVYAWLPLRSDESGYLLAARHWAPGAGEFVYGDYHVDRPPLLLAVYRLAALWESDAAIRLLTIPVVVAGVLALARAGFLLAGATGARWASVVGAALLSSPALAADQADGELFATVLVAGCVAATLQAWQSRRVPLTVGYGVLAGVLAAAAPLTKQNFLDGFVFIAVLLLVHAVQRRRAWTDCLVLGGSVAAGVLAVSAATIAWALSAGVDLGRMWTDLVAFRGEALPVILRGSLDAPLVRAGTLVVLATISAVVPIAWAWARWLRTEPRSSAPEHWVEHWAAHWAEHWAVSAVLVFAVCSIAAGGSFWPHYLLQVVTPVALVAAIVAADPGPAGRRMRRLGRFAAGSAVVAGAAMVTIYLLVPRVWFPERIGHWLADSGRATDTLYVAYGHPHVVEAADMTSPYPYLWSLPMRTYDPGQQRLLETLGGPEAPTWVVQINGLDSWEIDRGDRLRELIDDRYDHVADVCGFPVYLRSGVDRDPAPLPDC